MQELQNKNREYYLYIDEAQSITTFVTREVLNALKFNTKIIQATQSIDTFAKQIKAVDNSNRNKGEVRVLFL